MSFLHWGSHSWMQLFAQQVDKHFFSGREICICWSSWNFFNSIFQLIDVPSHSSSPVYSANFSSQFFIFHKFMEDVLYPLYCIIQIINEHINSIGLSTDPWEVPLLGTASWILCYWPLLIQPDSQSDFLLTLSCTYPVHLLLIWLWEVYVKAFAKDNSVGQEHFVHNLFYWCELIF